MGAVGGANFQQRAAGALHDLGDTEGAADFHQFPAGHRHLFAQCQCVEHQQHGRGVVVDRRGRLRAGEFTQHRRYMILALTALTGIEIKLQVGRIARSADHGVDRFLRQ